MRPAAKTMNLRFALFLTLCAAAGSAGAQESAEPPPVPEGDAAAPPAIEDPLPPKATPRDRLEEPAVKITRDEAGQLVEEYSLDGRIYMVKVTPKNAPPYYLLDTDGDGTLERDKTGLGPGISPVYWKLKEWD